MLYGLTAARKGFRVRYNEVYRLNLCNMEQTAWSEFTLAPIDVFALDKDAQLP